MEHPGLWNRNIQASGSCELTLYWGPACQAGPPPCDTGHEPRLQLHLNPIHAESGSSLAPNAHAPLACSLLLLARREGGLGQFLLGLAPIKLWQTLEATSPCLIQAGGGCLLTFENKH